MPRGLRCALSALTLFIFAGCGGEVPSPPAGNTELADDAASAKNASPAADFAKSKSEPADRARAGGESDDAAIADDAAAAAPVAAHGETPVARPGRPSGLDPSVQAGTLTAGSIDDVRNLDDFYNYLSKVGQRGRRGVELGRRVFIRVADAEGRAVGDALVTVTRPGGQQGPGQVLFHERTVADGQVQFLMRFDAPESTLPASGLEVAVTPPGGGEPVRQFLGTDEESITVQLPSARAQLPTQLDLALVIDTTGSMGDELEYLKVEIDNIAQRIKEQFPNVDQRFALVLYRDAQDDYVTRTFDFTDSLTEFRQTLARQAATGGGDYPEAMDLALDQATRLSWRSANTARVLFLVGDAPPHDGDVPQTWTALRTLREKSVRVFPVAGSGVGDVAQYVMRVGAYLTQGRYLFLTDHSGVGNAHARPDTPSYNVERLNDLMIRMVAGELAGRELAPKDILARERQEEPQQPYEPPVLEQFQQQTQALPAVDDPEPAVAETAPLLRWGGVVVLLGTIWLVEGRLGV